MDGASTSGFGLGCETEGGGWFASGSAPGKVTPCAPGGASMEWASLEALWDEVVRLRKTERAALAVADAWDASPFSRMGA